jgi:hypothetical protein
MNNKLIFFKWISKLLLLFLVVLCTSTIVQAQLLNKTEIKVFKKKEDSLNILSWRMSNESAPVLRMISDSAFTRILVRTLKLKNSFSYKFDSVQIAKAYAPDSSFRILTWEIEGTQSRYRQKGVIQYKTADGALRITPLIDNSDFVEGYDEVTTASNWIGAMYYNILMNEYNGVKQYTLIGFDNNNAESNKKWIDILTFDANNQPVFGAPIIEHKTKGTLNRLVIEYKKEARLKLNWDEEQQMIVYDHTSSENGYANQRKTHVPDGDYEGLKWEKGKWIHLEKVMCNCPLSNKENKEKIDKPLFDANGNRIPPPQPTPDN